MNLPVHTPYDGSSQPFAIGLKPLDWREWIEVDAHLEDYLNEKDRLYATVPEAVFAAKPDTQAAQQEVLDLLCQHLLQYFPDIYQFGGGMMGMPALNRTVPLEAEPPLMTAARLVQEDLVLMQRDETGWRLVAASLCFPSSWSLAKKFGRTLTHIHAPVPDFGEGTRADALINRMFDKLHPSNAVYRFNWSLQGDLTRFKPSPTPLRPSRLVLSPEGQLAGTFIRVERQTLRKLPRTGNILFTIRIYLDPLSALRSHRECAGLAGSLANQLDALDDRQLDYKGLTADRDRLVLLLRDLAKGGGLL